jgi:hypothetical protein
VPPTFVLSHCRCSTLQPLRAAYTPTNTRTHINNTPSARQLQTATQHSYI